MVETRSGRKLGQAGSGCPSSSQAARRRNEAAGGLPTLPLELIEAIGRPLSMKDRVALASCCGTLRSREDVAGSAQLWGPLTIVGTVSNAANAPLAAWLERRRAALRNLSLLTRDQQHDLDPGMLLASLAGSTLRALRLWLPLASYQALDALPQLPALTSLELSGSCLVNRVLPPQISALTGLLSLGVWGNREPGMQMRDTGWAPLQRLSSLTRLDISYCDLSFLPRQLSSLGAQVELSMERNKFDQERSLTVLQHLTTLTMLNARHCSIVHLPEQLSSLTRLAALNLTLCFYLGRQGEVAVAALQHLGPSLTYLSLAACSFERLPPHLSALSHLLELDLRGNIDLGVAGNDAALGLLEHLTRLTLLDLSHCSLRSLPPQLAALPSLAALDLNGNASMGLGSWEPLSQLSALTRLVVYECFLATPPKQVSALHALCDLNISWDMSMTDSGAFIDELCDVLQPLTRLTRLTCWGIEGDLLGERLAAAGVRVPCIRS